MASPEARDVVLNVNDTESARYLVSRILARAGLEVIEASTGAEALRLARERQPRVIVLDVRLPDVDGREIARALRADSATSSTAILLTSATFVSSDNKVAGLESGADAYLTQPFEPVELVALVQALLRSKRHETESHKRAAALAEAHARKDEFLAMLAHELRNPLSVIMSATSLLTENTDLDGQQSRLTQTIVRQTRHLAALVDDLLDVSRITQGKIHLKKVRLDLTNLVRTAVQSARTSLLDPRQHELVLSLPNEPLYVDADPTRIEQMIVNVVANAAKYTASRGRIAITLDAQTRDGQRCAVLSVRDNGIGIEPAHLDSVFDLFFQVDGSSLARSAGGLGIGLTMVRRLAELHGGRARVFSEGKGKGTEVSLELPLADPRSSVTETSERSGNARVPPMQLLVVDDNVDACELVKLTMELAGHTVTTAPEGETALRLALENRYDAIILDIGLPLLDGYEIAKRLSTQLGKKKPYLVALSGYGRQEDRDRAHNAGFDAHIVKPLDPRLLFDLLARRVAGAA